MVGEIDSLPFLFSVWVRNLKVEKTPWGDIEIYVKGVRFTVKKGYTPPYLWIEKARPRKGGYEIVLQLDADEELAEALDMVSTKIMEVLKEKGLTNIGRVPIWEE